MQSSDKGAQVSSETEQSDARPSALQNPQGIPEASDGNEVHISYAFPGHPELR